MNETRNEPTASAYAPAVAAPGHQSEGRSGQEVTGGIWLPPDACIEGDRREFRVLAQRGLLPPFTFPLKGSADPGRTSPSSAERDAFWVGWRREISEGWW